MASTNKLSLVSQPALAANYTSAAQSLQPRSIDLIGVINCLNVDAATTVDAKVQHSPDNIIWFDLITFTSVVGVASNELKNVSVPVLTYVRAVVTLSGTTKLADVYVDLYLNPHG